MKTTTLLIALAAIASAGMAQTAARIDQAVKRVMPPGAAPEQPTASLARGLMDKQGNALLSVRDSTFKFYNTTNAYTYDIAMPVPSGGNVTAAFPVGGGTFVTTPTTLTWRFTGTTYNLDLVATQPTVGSVELTIPDMANVDGALFLSTLTTNAVGAANSIWGASNGLVFEGATADAFETTLSVIDPTADHTISLPNASVATVMLLSSLTTNTLDAANSIWGISNGLVFEGATADAFETTISPTDPTADRTIILPDGTGTVLLGATATLTAGATPAFAPASSISTYLLTPGEDETIAGTVTGATAGSIYTLRILTSGTSSYTITFGSNFTSQGTLVTGTTSAITYVVAFVYDGTAFREISRTRDASSTVALTAASPTVLGSAEGIKAYTLTPTGSVTINAAVVQRAGEGFSLIILTSGTSSYTQTFGTGFVSTGTLATGTADGKTFIVRFRSNGTSYYEESRTVAMP